VIVTARGRRGGRVRGCHALPEQEPAATVSPSPGPPLWPRRPGCDRYLGRGRTATSSGATGSV